MKRFIKNIFKFIFLTTYILLVVRYIPLPVLNDYWFQAYTDVAKRMESPDYSKTAVLIRRNAFIDLNFIVKVKEEGVFKVLHVSRDFIPDFSVDFNEKLVWSDDSTMLVMTANDIDGNEYIWAYDFADGKEYLDKNIIMGLLKSKELSEEEKKRRKNFFTD